MKESERKRESEEKREEREREREEKREREKEEDGDLYDFCWQENEPEKIILLQVKKNRLK